MRALLWVILVAAVAVAIAVGARYNAGFVLIVLHPWRIELSLNLLLLALVAGFAACYALVRVVVRTLGLPSEVRMFRERRRADGERTALVEALRAYFEGRFGRAEQSAGKVVGQGELSGLAAVVAARSAHELRAFDRRDGYLARNANWSADDQVMRAVVRAGMLLEERRADEALAALAELPRKHTTALQLELRVAQARGEWDRVADLVGQLAKSGVYPPQEARELGRFALAESLRQKSADHAALDAAWSRLGADEQRDPRVAAVAARAYLGLDRCARAHEIIEAALAQAWDGELAALYGEASGEDVLRRIERAEAWLVQHPHDAGLLLGLGRLCAHQQLWGKARSYYEASLSLEPAVVTLMELGRLLATIGDTAAAGAHQQRALAVALEQLQSAGARRATGQAGAGTT